MTQLVKYETACRALAACKAVDEVKDLMDKAEAMRLYGRMAKDKTLETDAAEIRMRAERRLGQMLAQQKETVGLNSGRAGRSPIAVDTNDRDERPTLSQVGISKDLSSRAQKLAAVPEDQFENEVGQWRDRVQAEGARVTTRLEKAGEKALKFDPSEMAMSDADLDEENTRLQTENNLLNDTIKSLQVSDKDAEIKKLQERVYGLEGRIQQLMASEKSMESKLKYQTEIVHKLRKIYGVETHAEILAAAQAQVA